MSSSKARPYRTKVARRILTLQLPPTTTAFHAHARLVLMAYLYLPHEFDRPRLSHDVRRIAAYTGLHTETVKRTRKRLVDLGVLIKIGKRAGRNGLMKDVLTWGPVLIDAPALMISPDEPPAVASSNEQSVVARCDGRLTAASDEPLAAACPQLPIVASVNEQPVVAGLNEPLAVAGLNGASVAARPDEQPVVVSVNEQPAVAGPSVEQASLGGLPSADPSEEAPFIDGPDQAPALTPRQRRRRDPRANPWAASSRPHLEALTPEEREGLTTLHQFVRRVAESANAPVRILGALQPILEANDPEVVWNLVLKRNPYDTDDSALLRQAESLWRSRQLSPPFMNALPPIVV